MLVLSDYYGSYIQYGNTTATWCLKVGGEVSASPSLLLYECRYNEHQNRIGKDSNPYKISKGHLQDRL